MAVGGVVKGNTACPNYSDLIGIKGGYLDEAAGASVPWQGHALPPNRAATMTQVDTGLLCPSPTPAHTNTNTDTRHPFPVKQQQARREGIHF